MKQPLSEQTDAETPIHDDQLVMGDGNKMIPCIAFNFVPKIHIFFPHCGTFSVFFLLKL